MAYKVFISHSGIDTWVAEQIEKYLKETGAATFLDERNIEVGDNFMRVIIGEIKSSNEFFVLFTPWALERTYIWLEIGGAMVQEIRIIPILYGISVADFQLLPKVPSELKSLDIVDINDIGSYFNQLQSRVDQYNKSRI